MIDAIKDSIAHFQMWWLLYWHAVLAAVVMAYCIYAMFRYAYHVWPVVVVLLPTLISGGWLWYCIAYHWDSYCYKLTVTLDVDGKEVSRSEVYEVLRASTPLREALVISEQNTSYRIVVFGEAIYFPFPKSPLLVTMAGSGSSQGPNAASVLAGQVLNHGPTRLQEDSPYGKATAERVGAEVPINQLPIMITFADPAKPETWTVPSWISRDVGQENVSIKSAYLQLTTERPGWPELPKHLPWLRSLDCIFPIGIKETNWIGRRGELEKGPLINGYF